MKIPLSVLFGLLLLVSAFNWNVPSGVVAASAEQSTTPNTEAQQRERQEQAQRREREEQAQQSEREQYLKSTQAKLDEYDKKLDALEVRASTASGPAKDDLRNMIGQLRIQTKNIGSRLGYVRNASPDGFSVIKADVESTLRKLDGSYQELSKKIETAAASPSKNQQKSQ